MLTYMSFLFNDSSTTEIYTYLHTLSLHDSLPISANARRLSHRPIAPTRIPATNCVVRIWSCPWPIDRPCCRWCHGYYATVLTTTVLAASQWRKYLAVEGIWRGWRMG